MSVQGSTFRGSKGAGRHDQPSANAVGRPSKYLDKNGRKKSYKHKKHAFERMVEREQRYTRIAILDFETDPFDNQTQDIIKPFAACLHRADHDDIIIWENDSVIFIEKVLAAIKSLPGAYVIYAHNGGKFDYMFLIHKLRGEVNFKGRGLMEARIGNHVIRDSFHLIPEKLANWHKDNFDYTKMLRSKRDHFRKEITSYMRNDCRYLFEILSYFIYEHGFKLTIGQAGIAKLRESYRVKRITEYCDEQLRPYYFGGRVECLQGKGHFIGRYKLYDVNSMYPFVMARCYHPIGNNYTPRRGLPNSYTSFINLNCTNYGAFVSRGFDGGCASDQSDGNFLVTIHEYDAAIRNGLIDNVDIHWCVDNDEFSTFEKFVEPQYDERQKIKQVLRTLDKNSTAWFDLKKHDFLLKYLLNSTYGKFAQNPRNFKESYITDFGVRPFERDWGDLPKFENGDYALWERASFPWRFFNVGTGASITGAARAVLLDAICKSTDPLYCDTDSLICKFLDCPTDPSKLGYWDIEAEFDEVIIAGKKTYAARLAGSEEIKVRSKGVQFETETAWRDMLRLINGDQFPIVSRGPTLTRRGTQNYLTRNIRATAPNRISRILERQ
jgi:hypothetical protein